MLRETDFAGAMLAAMEGRESLAITRNNEGVVDITSRFRQMFGDELPPKGARFVADVGEEKPKPEPRIVMAESIAAVRADGTPAITKRTYHKVTDITPEKPAAKTTDTVSRRITSTDADSGWMGPKPTDESALVGTIIRMRDEEHKPPTKIAKELGIPLDLVFKVTIPHSREKEKQRDRRKIPDEVRAKVVEMGKDGKMSQAQIARELDISRASVSKILSECNG